jgi:predicted RNase H-related nuclease YkuK (DUF458 family)
MITWHRKKTQWLNAHSEPVNFSDIISKINERRSNDIYVGCDSHKKSGVYIFAVVIALHLKGNGGIFFFYRNRSKDKQLDNIHIRLMKETELTLRIARKIQEQISDRSIHVHLDINPKTIYASSIVLPSAVSWVKSCGFTPSVKPDAWASSCLADAFAR